MKEDFEKQRKELVKKMKASGVIKTIDIENAFLSIPRHEFFPEEIREHAYDDNAFPIGFGQTISQPTTNAIMLETLSPRKGMRVLEIGSGSGYVVALLSKIVGAKGKVFGIDIIPELVERAKKTIKKIKIKNIELKCADGRHGCKEHAPYDRILVSAASDEVPSELFGQLKEHGLLLAPINYFGMQELTLFEKRSGEVQEKERQGYFSFVPMLGKEKEKEEGPWRGVT